MVSARCLRLAAILWLVAFFVSLTGCGGNKISKSNYDKINPGMSEADVEGVLGKGEEQASLNMPAVNVPGMPNLQIQGMPTSAKAKKWQDGNRVITVMFMDGKVVSKTQIGL
jgi:hypothetical protein